MRRENKEAEFSDSFLSNYQLAKNTSLIPSMSNLSNENGYQGELPTIHLPRMDM